MAAMFMFSISKENTLYADDLDERIVSYGYKYYTMSSSEMEMAFRNGTIDTPKTTEKLKWCAEEMAETQEMIVNSVRDGHYRSLI